MWGNKSLHYKIKWSIELEIRFVCFELLMCFFFFLLAIVFYSRRACSFRTSESNQKLANSSWMSNVCVVGIRFTFSIQVFAFKYGSTFSCHFNWSFLSSPRVVRPTSSCVNLNLTASLHVCATLRLNYEPIVFCTTNKR